MDNRVYLCDNLQLEKGLVQSFSGVGLNIFVKAAISLDASNVVCGSSDGNAYVWKVDKSQEYPTILKSHDGKVTTVTW
ncbi:denticleless protein homolog isoform X2 [Cajanus cajan]|uniref:denticleless protein homolog isoform X2 n=1 Tax=Cajanus cajan TaxID=3821 RepID=UPI0010FB27FD|nr:denticleless protein homolog isoform X2 [Cajanus cajan]